MANPKPSNIERLLARLHTDPAATCCATCARAQEDSGAPRAGRPRGAR